MPRPVFDTLALIIGTLSVSGIVFSFIGYQAGYKQAQFDTNTPVD